MHELKFSNANHEIKNGTIVFVGCLHMYIVPYVSATCQLACDMAIAEKVSGGGPGGPMGAQSISPETTLNVLFSTRIFH
jgi:hypothetical protein